jgi:hypothetical protein
VLAEKPGVAVSRSRIQGRPGPDLGDSRLSCFQEASKGRGRDGARPSSAAEPTIGWKHLIRLEGEDMFEAGRRPGHWPREDRRGLIRARPARATIAAVLNTRRGSG